MNKIIIAALFMAMVFVQAADKVDNYDSAKVHDIVEKLKKHDYGRNILTTIQLEIANGVDESAIKRIVRMLNELLEQVQNELTTLTAERGRKNGYCSGKVDELTATLGRLTVDVSEREASVPPVENLRDQKDKDRKAKEQEISIKQDDLRQLHEANEEERQEYFKQREEHDNLITELNKAKDIISSLRKTSFLEKKDHQAILAQLQSHATDALKNIKLAHKKSIFTFVMTLAQQVGVQADQDLVKKVTNIIDELIAEEEYAKQIEFEAENLRLERFEFD
jgi:sirohydrochlorin ferrochelatase